MAKVFSEVISGGKAYPVWDASAHAEILGVSGDLTAHAASDVHITEPDRTKWDAKLDASALNDYATTAALNAHSTNLTVHVSAPDKQAWNDHKDNTVIHITSAERKDWNAKLDPSAISEMATTGWVTEQGYLTAHQSLADYYKKNETSGAINSGAAASAWIELSANSLALDSDLDELENSFTAYMSSVSAAINSGAAASAWLETSANELATKTALAEALEPYATSAWVEETLNDYLLSSEYSQYIASVSGAIASGSAASAWIENFTPTSSLSGGDYIKIEDDIVSVTGLDTIINAQNGVSAEWNNETSAWDIGLERDIAAYGRYTTLASATEKTGKVYLLDLNEEEKYADHIKKNSAGDGVTVLSGLYHIDAKVLLTVVDETADYASAKFACETNPERSTTMPLDMSFAHTEAISLSFDLMNMAETDLKFSLTLPAGVQYRLSDCDIHEVLSVQALLQGGAADIVAGNGLVKDGNSLSVNAGPGLKINDDVLQIAVKENGGLKFEVGEIPTELELTLDSVTEETVQEAKAVANDLDEKVTTTYAYANITGYSDMTEYGATTKNGVLLRYLFSVPIKNTVYVRGKNAEENAKVTLVSVYASQAYTQKPVIFGIYEYDPEKPSSDGTLGRTVALCDTGPVTIKQGLNEFEMKNFNTYNPDVTPELKSSCIYYASLYVSKNCGSGLHLATCPGYAAKFNAIPQITMDQSNIGIDLTEKPNTSFNDFGWGADAYHELPTCTRVFMQFRNKKITV